MLTPQEKTYVACSKRPFLSPSLPYPLLNRAYKNQSLPRLRRLCILGQNKRTTSQNGRVLSSSRTRAKPQSQRLEFLRSQLPGPFEFSRVRWAPGTVGGLGRGQADLTGRGWGGARRARAGRGWAGLGGAGLGGGAGRPRRCRKRGRFELPLRADTHTAAFSAGSATGEPQPRPGDGGRTRLYSKWRENSGARVRPGQAVTDVRGSALQSLGGQVSPGAASLAVVSAQVSPSCNVLWGQQGTDPVGFPGPKRSSLCSGTGSLGHSVSLPSVL